LRTNYTGGNWILDETQFRGKMAASVEKTIELRGGQGEERRIRKKEKQLIGASYSMTSERTMSISEQKTSSRVQAEKIYRLKRANQLSYILFRRGRKVGVFLRTDERAGPPCRPGASLTRERHSKERVRDKHEGHSLKNEHRASKVSY